ncbi:hypothetical protein SAMD00019534_006300 [Acytostelium subglobosum LB1]|uniref:hypothetical protein n=1 Tax=Acytostelium subglobosum LB1 TaxID=1410327 RepID=UPI000644E053|nr:hypothetical protein SAMD00019534_006300 [Acytostelium subglobosum LB1]GAM17455.1 hypothetical protein SAMD00019534_006300 [Acytostelium subglobosum LB1]|eukprot:XP_012759517.1 hypothetical protein SAMD00019534_006300 [Acytostelium subglobosum LB1]
MTILSAISSFGTPSVGSITKSSVMTSGTKSFGSTQSSNNVACWGCHRNLLDLNAYIGVHLGSLLNLDANVNVDL